MRIIAPFNGRLRHIGASQRPAGRYQGQPVESENAHQRSALIVHRIAAIRGIGDNKDDGQGGFLNELDIKNTYDPSPYFNLSFNYSVNPDNFAICEAQVTVESWGQ